MVSSIKVFMRMSVQEDENGIKYIDVQEDENGIKYRDVQEDECVGG